MVKDQVVDPPASAGHRVDEQLEALHGANLPTATIDGADVLWPPGENIGSVPFGTAVTRSGRNPELEQLVAGRVRRGDGQAAPVERRRDARFERPSERASGPGSI